MNDMQSILEDASILVAESRFAQFLVEDIEPVPETNKEPKEEPKDEDPKKETLSDKIVGPHEKVKNTNLIPEDTQDRIEFTKNDLKDIDKIKKIEGKVERTKNINMAKTIFRSTLSLGALAVGAFTAAPIALVSSTTIAINLLLNMHGNKKDNDLANMQLLLDKKNSEMQKAYLLERDPKKKSEMKEYMNALNTATLKIKAARGR